MNTALQQWIDDGGSAQLLAEALGTSRQLVYYWARQGLPAWRIKAVAEASGLSEKKLKEGNRNAR